MTTVVRLVLLANSLSSLIIFACCDAVLENLFANEVWHGVGVVLKARSRTVGGAGAGIVESGGVAVVTVNVATAKSTTSVDLGGAPLGSQSCGDRVRVNGGVGSCST